MGQLSVQANMLCTILAKNLLEGKRDTQTRQSARYQRAIHAAHRSHCSTRRTTRRGSGTRGRPRATRRCTAAHTRRRGRSTRRGHPTRRRHSTRRRRCRRRTRTRHARQRVPALLPREPAGDLPSISKRARDVVQRTARVHLDEGRVGGGV